jgi:cytochrome c oxidase subunit II
VPERLRDSRAETAAARRGVCSAVAVAVAGLLAVAGCGGGAGSSPASTPAAHGAALGKVLYSSRGCASCHSIDGAPGVGPTWKGLAGARVKLADGHAVTANSAYLMRAIEHPDKQIVAGYQRGVMSGSVPPGSISPADAKALVAYIETLR